MVSVSICLGYRLCANDIRSHRLPRRLCSLIDLEIIGIIGSVPTVTLRRFVESFGVPSASNVRVLNFTWHATAALSCSRLWAFFRVRGTI